MNELQITDFTFQGKGPYNLAIAAGTVSGLQGASGAGKSLLLRAIADLDPHQGTARLGSMLCHEVPAQLWRKTVGMLPAESFWWHDTVGEHFHVPVQELEGNLFQLGFDAKVVEWQVSRMSTGEKQRLAVVRLLQNKPQALLLDEPTASLDKANIESVEKLLLNYGTEQQVPMLWVSHDPDQLERVADSLYFMESNGCLLQRS